MPSFCYCGALLEKDGNDFVCKNHIEPYENVILSRLYTKYIERGREIIRLLNIFEEIEKECYGEIEWKGDSVSAGWLLEKVKEAKNV